MVDEEFEPDGSFEPAASAEEGGLRDRGSPKPDLQSFSILDRIDLGIEIE